MIVASYSSIQNQVVATRGSIYLLADSQTLFLSGVARLFSEEARSLQTESDPRAAYLGAANGDDPAFYGIFEAAMDVVGISERRLIPSCYSAEDSRYLASANVIVVAGGDIYRGAAVLSSTGMGQMVIDRHFAGAVIVGVSAGAVLLGQSGWIEDSQSSGSPTSAERVAALSLVPWMVDAHEEAEGWSRLLRRLGQAEPYTRGLGIPSGAGLIVHGDGSVQPLHKPILELTRRGAETVHALLMPEIGELSRPPLAQAG